MHTQPLFTTRLSCLCTLVHLTLAGNQGGTRYLLRLLRLAVPCEPVLAAPSTPPPRRAARSSGERPTGALSDGSTHQCHDGRDICQAGQPSGCGATYGHTPACGGAGDTGGAPRAALGAAARPLRAGAGRGLGRAWPFYIS